MFPFSHSRGGGAAAASSSAWSTTDKSQYFILSNNNTRAANTASPAQTAVVRGTKSASDGWAHVEMTMVAKGGLAATGLYSTGVTLDAQVPPYNEANTIYYGTDGAIYVSGNRQGNFQTIAVGNTVGFDYNKTTGAYVVIGSDGNIALNGSISAGTIVFPGAGSDNGNQTWDLNTGQSAFTRNPNNRPAWG